ncbi:MAG: hypothetical protein ACXWBN_00595 [Acidimicrobiales bacterium]
MTVPSEVEARPRPPARTKRRWPPVTSLVLGVGFAVWGVSIGIDQLSDNSFFTHLATGRLILANGIPHHDLYSFTAAGEPWVVQSWLASVLYGWIDSWFGVVGLRLLMAALTGALGAMVWRLTRPARSLAGRIVIAGCVLGVGSSVWAPRPLLIGLVLLTIALLVAEKGLDPRWLLPVFWLWVNVHGSFPLGLVALGCLWIGARADGKDGAVELRGLLWGGAGTLLGAVSPLGPVLLIFPVRLLGRMDVLRQVIEWQSPSFSSAWTRLFLIQVVIAVLALVRRPSYRAAIPLVVFTAAALLGVRNIAVASIVLVPGTARGLADLGSIRGDRRSPVNAVAIGVVVLVGALLLSNGLAKPAWQLEAFPVDAVSWLDQNGMHRDDLHMATPDTVGNYLELVYGDQAHAFVDDRVDMYPKPVVEDFVVLLHGAPGWRAVLDRRDVDLVLWERSEPLTNLMAESSDWRIIYSDPSWVVGCRRGTDLGGTGSLATC